MTRHGSNDTAYNNNVHKMDPNVVPSETLVFSPHLDTKLHVQQPYTQEDWFPS